MDVVSKRTRLSILRALYFNGSVEKNGLTLTSLLSIISGKLTTTFEPFFSSLAIRSFARFDSSSGVARVRLSSLCIFTGIKGFKVYPER